MIRVMLIDQEKLYQRAFQKLISREPDCELVAIAENGMEAMQAVEKYHPQMIFSEVLLGSENGIDVLRGIKNNYPEIDTYILTGYSNINLVQSSIRMGVERYIFKPLSREFCEQLFRKDDVRDEKEEDIQLIPILKGIEDHDYKASYDATEEYVTHIFDKYSTDERKKKLKRALIRLIYLIPGMEQSQKKYYIQKYELTHKIVNKNMHCYSWLISVITEVFRQLCVMKYAQMNKVFQYIENNINSEISMTDLAGIAGISNGYLSRIFKKYYHISMVDFIHLRKMVIAKHYMIYSEMNISDISFLLGYSEAGYFCKIFKKYENMTPSEYSNSKSKEN